MGLNQKILNQGIFYYREEAKRLFSLDFLSDRPDSAPLFISINWFCLCMITVSRIDLLD